MPRTPPPTNYPTFRPTEATTALLPAPLELITVNRNMIFIMDLIKLPSREISFNCMILFLMFVLTVAVSEILLDHQVIITRTVLLCTKEGFSGRVLL